MAQTSAPPAVSLQPTATELPAASTIASATIGGDLEARGAQLRGSRVPDGQRLALHAQLAAIDGSVSCDSGEGEPFVAHGNLNFYGAKVAGPLMFTGAQVCGGDYPGTPDSAALNPGTPDCAALNRGTPGSAALNLHAATLMADVWLDSGPDIHNPIPLRIPTVELGVAVIKGTIHVTGPDDPLRYATPEQMLLYGDAIECIHGPGLRLNGDLEVSRPVSSLRVSDAVIEGNLTVSLTTDIDLRATVVKGKVTLQAPPWVPAERVDAVGMKAGSDVELVGLLVRTDLSSCVVDGDLILGAVGKPLLLDGRMLGQAPALKLVGAAVRTLNVAQLVVPRPFPVDLAVAKRHVLATDLLAYPGWRLAEVSFRSCFGKDKTIPKAVVAFFYRPDGQDEVVILNGDSRQINDFNYRWKPILKDPETVRQYLSVFCHYTWAEKGAFFVDDRTAQVCRIESNDSIIRKKFKEEVGRCLEDGSWRAESEVDYDKKWHLAQFIIEPSGTVTMTDESPIEREPERLDVSYDPPLRWCKAPGAHDLIPPLRGLTNPAGKWPTCLVVLGCAG